MNSHLEKLVAIMKAGQEEIEAMMEACLEKMEATDLVANPEIESKSEHQEFAKEEVSLETVLALEDQCGNRHLVVGCC
jgi:hypothetical protein